MRKKPVNSGDKEGGNIGKKKLAEARRVKLGTPGTEELFLDQTQSNAGPVYPGNAILGSRRGQVQ